MEIVEPTAIAYLRAGPWAATQTALAMMAVRGQIVAGPPGRIQRAGASPPVERAVEHALYCDLYTKLGAREASMQPLVQEVLRDLRARLERRGYLRPRWRRVVLPPVLLAVSPVLVGWLGGRGGVGGSATVMALLVFVVLAAWFIPRRTVAGAKALRAARRRHTELGNLVASGTKPAAEIPPETVGIVVALFGTAALRAFMPRVAADAGLVDGGKWTRHDVEPAKRNPWPGGG